ncbi:MAG TPA: NAD(P)/FAD-dependent oxidoreductase [Acidimicrobiia bacterium]
MAREYDAVVVGSGPNGLVAAVTLARAGWKVLVLEAADRPGGGTRSEELTLPGLTHDVCSAIHPLAVGSPAFRALPLHEHGLTWVHPDVPLVHPLDGGDAVVLDRSVDVTAQGLGADGDAYRRLFEPLVSAGMGLVDDLLSPLRIPPRHPLAVARYGLDGIRSTVAVARSRFETEEARALFAGLSGHSMLSLRAPMTAGFGMVLAALGHLVGWPMPRGGSQSIASALVSLLEAHDGEVVTGRRVTSLHDLPDARATMLDVTPRQVLHLFGYQLPPRYARRLARYRHGVGVWKVDWALDAPIPWSAPECRRAATVHLGATLPEIAAAEDEVQAGRHPRRPLVLLVQPTLFDDTRAPAGMHTAWAYCHVPNGSTVDMTAHIEDQVERFAPGFRTTILARHVMSPSGLEAHDANYVGGDINGGVADIRQFAARPVASLHPWRLPVKGMYLCSASTPPGGGVHGMCGWQAAREALRRER